MGAFEDLHGDRVIGSLAMFDRMIFKGRLTALYKQNARVRSGRAKPVGRPVPVELHL